MFSLKQLVTMVGNLRLLELIISHPVRKFSGAFLPAVELYLQLDMDKPMPSLHHGKSRVYAISHCYETCLILALLCFTKLAGPSNLAGTRGQGLFISWQSLKRYPPHPQ
jgi:hypothetical protein